VRRDDNGRSLAIERAKKMQQALGHCGIDVAGWLIRDQQVGAVDYGARNRDPLLLTARERRRASTRAIGKPDPGQHLPDGPLDLLVALAGNAQWQSDIVECGEVADQSEVLEHDADAAAEIGQDLARSVAELLAEDADSAARRPLGEVKQLEQRGLPSTRGPREEVKPAVGEPEVEVAQHLGPRAVAQANAVEFRDLRQLLSLPAHLQDPLPCQAMRIPVYPALTVPEEAFVVMILTCPNCSTQYVVKDGAIPPQGRQVRCASCKHSWHQDPDASAEPETAPEAQMAPEPEVAQEDETIAEATLIDPRSGPEAEERAYEEAVIEDSDEAPVEAQADASQSEAGEDRTREAAEYAAELRAQALTTDSQLGAATD